MTEALRKREFYIKYGENEIKLPVKLNFERAYQIVVTDLRSSRLVVLKHGLPEEAPTDKPDHWLNCELLRYSKTFSDLISERSFSYPEPINTFEGDWRRAWTIQWENTSLPSEPTQSDFAEIPEIQKIGRQYFKMKPLSAEDIERLLNQRDQIVQADIQYATRDSTKKRIQLRSQTTFADIIGEERDELRLNMEVIVPWRG